MSDGKKTKKVCFRLEEDVYARLKFLSEKERVPLSYLLRRLIMSYLRRKKLLSLAFVFLLGSCATKGNLHEVPAYESLKDTSAVLRIKSSAYYVTDDAGGDLPGKRLSVSVRAGETLGEVARRLPYKVRVPEDLSVLKAPDDAELDGSPEEVLEELSALYGVYWRYSNGVLTFRPYKTLIYRFPLVSRELLKLSYGDNPDVSSLSKDLLEEIAEELEKFLLFRSRGFSESVLEEREKQGNALSLKGKVQKSREKGRTDTKTYELQKRSNEMSQREIKSKESDKRKSEGTTEKGSVTKGGRKTQGDRILDLELSQLLKEKGTKNEVREEKRKSLTTSSGFSQKGVSDVRRGETAEKSREYSERETSGREEKVSGSSLRFSYRRELKEERRVLVLKNGGIIAVRVRREEEPVVRKIMKRLIEQRFNNLVYVKIYLFEVSGEREFSFGLGLSSRYLNGRTQSGLNLGDTTDGKLFFKFIGNTFELKSVLDFLVRDAKARLLSSPSLITLSGFPARVRSVIEFPYLEPNLSYVSTTGITQIPYEVKKVEDGIDLLVVPYVLGDSVILSVSVKADQYLGDKVLQAGQIGEVQLPISAPRTYKSTLRLKVGQAVLVGGIEFLNSSREASFGSGISFNTKGSSRRLYFILVPKLVKFEGG